MGWRSGDFSRSIQLKPSLPIHLNHTQMNWGATMPPNVSRQGLPQDQDRPCTDVPSLHRDVINVGVRIVHFRIVKRRIRAIVVVEGDLDGLSFVGIQREAHAAPIGA